MYYKLTGTKFTSAEFSLSVYWLIPCCLAFLTWLRSSTLTPHEANSTVGSLAFRQNRYYRQNAYDFNLLLKFASISEFQIHFFPAAFTRNKIISILPFLNIRPRMVRNVIFSTSLVASFDTQSAEQLKMFPKLTWSWGGSPIFLFIRKSRRDGICNTY